MSKRRINWRGIVLCIAFVIIAINMLLAGIKQVMQVHFGQIFFGTKTSILWYLSIGYCIFIIISLFSKSKFLKNAAIILLIFHILDNLTSLFFTSSVIRQKIMSFYNVDLLDYFSAFLGFIFFDAVALVYFLKFKK